MTELSVDYNDVLDALPWVREVLPPTALIEWPGLSELLGCQFFVKHENHHPVGAFKVRGGINLIGTLSDEEKAGGILGCSTGNHGQSLAFACRRFGVECTIVVPEGNNPDKNAAIRGLGATLIEAGRHFDEARDYMEREVVPQGGRYVHSANEPKLIAGVGTMACEIFDVLPDPDVIIVPIGLGSGVCGNGIVAKAVRPQTTVIGVQASGADAVARSWKSGRMETSDRVDTWAEGMATGVPAEMTMDIMRQVMDDVIIVDDDELRRASFSLLKRTHNLAEGAGAATLAAAYQQRERFAGKKVVAVLSGGNLDLAELPRIMAAGELRPD
jgi:threonine dehydratase